MPPAVRRYGPRSRRCRCRATLPRSGSARSGHQRLAGRPPCHAADPVAGAGAAGPAAGSARHRPGNPARARRPDRLLRGSRHLPAATAGRGHAPAVAVRPGCAGPADRLRRPAQGRPRRDPVRLPEPARKPQADGPGPAHPRQHGHLPNPAHRTTDITGPDQPGPPAQRARRREDHRITEVTQALTRTTPAGWAGRFWPGIRRWRWSCRASALRVLSARQAR